MPPFLLIKNLLTRKVSHDKIVQASSKVTSKAMPTRKEPPILIRKVWNSNIESEFQIIRSFIHQFPFISMDTEFPGVIFPPSPEPLKPSVRYQYLKSNVDRLNLIQVGLTFSDAEGNLPSLGTLSRFIWEFNFSDFDVKRDSHAPDSIDLLRRQGIDFRRNSVDGIPSWRFVQMIVSSRLVGNHSVTWVTFHGAYDFGYLLKILWHKKLPNRLEDFLRLLKLTFGNEIYDVKHIMRFCDSLYGGLERVAKTLNVERAAGKSHQAGSDSLLTWQAFQKIRDTYFVKDVPRKHAGVLFGLEVSVF